MAAKKGKATKTKTVYRKAKKAKRSHKRPVTHYGVVAGGLFTGAAMILNEAKGSKYGSAPAVNWFKDKSQPMSNRIKYGMEAIKVNAGQLSNYTPLAVGAAITISPKIPIVKLIAQPVNNQVKNMTHQKGAL